MTQLRWAVIVGAANVGLAMVLVFAATLGSSGGAAASAGRKCPHRWMAIKAAVRACDIAAAGRRYLAALGELCFASEDGRGARRRRGTPGPGAIRRKRPAKHKVALGLNRCVCTRSGCDRTRLERILKIGRPWQVLVNAASEARKGGDFARAAALYQEALDEIAIASDPPRRETIISLFRRAETMALLSPVHVARVDGRGRPGGLWRLSYRGWKVVRRAAPIEFVYDSVKFTKKGAKAAASLSSFLKRAGWGSVTLTGHTDERGRRAYNKKLSLRRAKAVAAYLRSHGFAGTIRPVGRGEEQPFEADDRSSYSREQIWQLDRRVEISK